MSECLNSYYGYENIPPGIRAPNFLAYRKMKLSSSINMKQSEKRLAKKLRQKFKRDLIAFIGNSIAANVKYHKPTKGVGIKNMLQKEGFKVYLLDDFKPPSLCSSGKDDTPFENTKKLKPFRRLDELKMLL